MANPFSVRPIPSAQRFQDQVDATPTRDAELTLELSPLWSEGALYYKDGVLGSAAVGGLYCNIAYRKRVGAFVKARSESFSVQNSNVTGLKPGQSAVGLGADWQAFNAVGEVLFRGQELSARGLEKWNWTAMWGEFQIEGELRHSWKYASGMKNELRASVSASGEPFYYGGRVQVQKGKDWSGLCYLEAGLKHGFMEHGRAHLVRRHCSVRPCGGVALYRGRAGELFRGARSRMSVRRCADVCENGRQPCGASHGKARQDPVFFA